MGGTKGKAGGVVAQECILDMLLLQCTLDIQEERKIQL